MQFLIYRLTLELSHVSNMCITLIINDLVNKCQWK